MTPDWVTEVLHFWFEELEPKAWFHGDATLDDEIRARFGALHERLRHAVPDEALASPEAALAAVIAIDQFARNLYRDRPEAFAADPAALELAQDAIARGYDQAFPPLRRQFFYLPFQHSEDAAMQARAVEFYRGLGMPESLDFAEKHRAIIDRFGRFPHRNAVLGRASTPAELEFLKQGRGF